MAASASQVVTIVADDLTGACDTGCLFAGAGPVGVIAEPDLSSSDRPVITVDTESRILPPDAAGAAVAAELAVLLEHGFSGALVCPAFPAQQRVVRDGRLLVDSVPVHESPIGRDPAFRAATSDMVGLLAGVRPVARLRLDHVRAG